MQFKGRGRKKRTVFRESEILPPGVGPGASSRRARSAVAWLQALHHVIVQENAALAINDEAGAIPTGPTPPVSFMMKRMPEAIPKRLMSTPPLSLISLMG